MSSWVPWADLPSELLSLIAKHLETGSDVRHFRAVCRSWRSCSPLPPNHFSLLLPHNLSSGNDPFVHTDRPLVIFSSNIYLLLPRHDHTTQNPPKPWLLWLEESNPAKLRLRFPLTHYTTNELPEDFPININLSDFRVTLVDKGYHLRGQTVLIMMVNKVVLFNCDFTATVLCEDGRLYAVRLTNGEWNSIKFDRISKFDDMLNFKGQIYVVDRRGRLYKLSNRTLDLDLIVSDPICAFHQGETRKRFVESDGEVLHLVRRRYCRLEVYKLNEVERRWDRTENLGDKILFVGTNCCFSASADDFPGWRGNCIVFSIGSFPSYRGSYYPDGSLKDEDNPYVEVGVFYFGDERCKPISAYQGYSDILWPPPTWFRSHNEEAQRNCASNRQALEGSSSQMRSEPSI